MSSGSTLEFSLTFGVPAKVLFAAMTDQMEWCKITRGPAQFENKEGGAFNFFGGKISGVNQKITQDEEIVQTWKMNDWSQDSTVTFTFDDNDDEVELYIEQKGLPASMPAERMKQGWMQMIFEPLSGLCGFPITERN